MKEFKTRPIDSYEFVENYHDERVLNEIPKKRNQPS